MANCKSCGRSIEWATSETTGKWIPIDAEPTVDGNLVVVKGVARVFTPEDKRLCRDRRTSHFATCPDANDHRRRSA